MKRTLLCGVILCTVWAAGGSPMTAARAPSDRWLRLKSVTSSQTVQIESAERSGKSTYHVASEAVPVEAFVIGPTHLRLLLRPEFPAVGAPPEEIRVTVSITGKAERGTVVVVQGMPARNARYASGAGFPGEAHAAFFDIPEGNHSVRVSSGRRVAVQFYVDGKVK
jgi:hypothetical protein